MRTNAGIEAAIIFFSFFGWMLIPFIVGAYLFLRLVNYALGEDEK